MGIVCGGLSADELEDFHGTDGGSWVGRLVYAYGPGYLAQHSERHQTLHDHALFLFCSKSVGHLI